MNNGCYSMEGEKMSLFYTTSCCKSKFNSLARGFKKIKYKKKRKEWPRLTVYTYNNTKLYYTIFYLLCVISVYVLFCPLTGWTVSSAFLLSVGTGSVLQIGARQQKGEMKINQFWKYHGEYYKVFGGKFEQRGNVSLMLLCCIDGV